MTHFILRLARSTLTAILFLSASLAQGYAQPTSPIDGVETRRLAIEAAASDLETNADADYLKLRESLRGVRADAIAASRPLAEMRDEVQTDLDRLGPCLLYTSPSPRD